MGNDATQVVDNGRLIDRRPPVPRTKKCRARGPAAASLGVSAFFHRSGSEHFFAGFGVRALVGEIAQANLRVADRGGLKRERLRSGGCAVLRCACGKLFRKVF